MQLCGGQAWMAAHCLLWQTVSCSWSMVACLPSTLLDISCSPPDLSAVFTRYAHGISVSSMLDAGSS